MITLAAVGIAIGLALSANVRGPRALPGVLRTGAVVIALWGLCGWGLSNLLVRRQLSSVRLLLVLPVGAASSSFVLAVLGLLHVPFAASLAIVLAAALAAALRWRTGSAPETVTEPLPEQQLAGAVRIAAPTVLVTLMALVSLIPSFWAGFESIPGQNGDAILVAGSATLVEHAPPTATRNDLPINRIPLQWRSKYPIYYALAAVATLAGQTPIQAFGTVSGVVLAMTALGLFVFSLFALRAPPWVALAATVLVPLDRIVMFVTIHPFYNELWGQFTLPLILLFGWLYLRQPSRGTGLLFVLFLVFGLLAYPLMIPFPVLFLVPYAWRRWREQRRIGGALGWISALGLPRPGARRWLWIPILLVAIPIAAVLVRGFFEKTISAFHVLLPGSSLAGWSGGNLHFLPGPMFVGLPGAGLADYIGLGVICALALLGLGRVRPEFRAAMATMVIGTALVGVYFRLRAYGNLFYFKDLAFLGPYVVILALLGIAALISTRSRTVQLAGAAAMAGLAVIVPIGAAREIDHTFVQVTPQVLELSRWDHELPRGQSIRIDVPPLGWQLWTEYMLHDHPLSVLVPLSGPGGFFPHPPVGHKAHYILTMNPEAKPTDALGGPVLQNLTFKLWRMNPQVPGPDVSRRGLIWGVTKVTL